MAALLTHGRVVARRLLVARLAPVDDLQITITLLHVLVHYISHVNNYVDKLLHSYYDTAAILLFAAAHLYTFFKHIVVV